MADSVNYKKEKIDAIPVLRKPSYGTGKTDKSGRPEVNWKLLIDADEQGFDIKYKEENGKHRMTIVLPKHTKLIRYGSEAGLYTAPKGTRYEEVSLPYTKESVFYHEYEVIAESITVTGIMKGCIVERGRVAPGFDYPGGGIQYLHPYNMIRSINLKLIREIEND